jgi:hypothetical protein
MHLQAGSLDHAPNPLATKVWPSDLEMKSIIALDPLLLLKVFQMEEP